MWSDRKAGSCSCLCVGVTERENSHSEKVKAEKKQAKTINELKRPLARRWEPAASE